MTTRDYVNRIRGLERDLDGDTYWLHLDPGLRLTSLQEVRLSGFDAPEMRAPANAYEKGQAIIARTIAHDWLTQRLADQLAGTGRLFCQTDEDEDSFGRWLGKIWWEDVTGELLLGDVLRAQRLASVWPTRWRDEFGL